MADQDEIVGIPIIGINKKATDKLNKEIKVLAVTINYHNKILNFIFKKLYKKVVATNVLIRYRSDYK